MERHKPRAVLASLVDDDENIVTDRSKIREAATKYYKDLFHNKSMGNTKHDAALHTLTTQPWNLWKLDEVCFNSEMVATAMALMTVGKTCGRDGLVSEVWRAAAWVDERLPAQIPSAANMRLANGPS